MTVQVRKAIAIAMFGVPFAALTQLVNAGYREQQGVTAAEIIMLPKFCWAQIEVPNARGPEYSPQGCGVGTNHYCPGLVKFIRAKRLADKQKMVAMLAGVENDIKYTEGWIKDYPKCSIRSHLESTKTELQKLRGSHGNPGPQKKSY